MSRRIEIELTSARPDGTWTWRAAGAREPKGVLAGSILPDGTKVGEVLKVDADFDVDGINVIAVVSSQRSRKEPTLLQLLPVERPFEAVTQQLVRKERRDRDDRGPRRDRDDRGPRGDRPPRDARGERPDRGPRRDRPEGAGAARGERPGRGDRPPRPEGERGERPPRREPRPARPHFTPPPEMPARPKAKRLKPGRAHRSEILQTLPEEQRPIAELTLQGLAAVRQRLREDNQKLKAEGKPEMPEASVMKMAEELMPKIRVAEWLDRAEAAKRDLDELDLRDLRSVVASSEDPIVARDETTRALANELKAALATKQETATREWLEDIGTAIDIGRVVRALKMSSEPPKAGTPFPAELKAKLANATTAALTADASSDRWLALVESLAFSPVRTVVAPGAPPSSVSDELKATVTRLGPAIPQIAALFGIEVAEGAPMPKPPRVARRPDKKPSKPAPVRDERPAPVETAPVETAPAEMAPVETAPVETAPVEMAPADITDAPAEVIPEPVPDPVEESASE